MNKHDKNNREVYLKLFNLMCITYIQKYHIKFKNRYAEVKG